MSLDNFSPEAPIGSPSPFWGGWGWKANHVSVCLICISIALLSFEWFVFKHEVGICKHTQTCLCTHTHTQIHKQTQESHSACVHECCLNHPLVRCTPENTWLSTQTQSQCLRHASSHPQVKIECNCRIK